MAAPASAPARPAKPRPKRPAYREIDYLRDGMLIAYIVYLLSSGLQILLLGGGGGAGGGSLLNQAMTAALLGVGVVCCLYDRVPFRRVLLGVGPFILPAILILVSISWSDYPDIGGRRALRFVMELAGFIFLLSAYRDTRSFLRALWIAFAILLALDVAALALPAMSFTELGYAGVHIHKNSMGSFAYISIPLFFIGWRQRFIGQYSIVSLGLALIGLVFLLISLSKTAMFLLPACSVMAFVGYTIWKRGLTTQLSLGALFLIAVLGLAAPLSATGLNVAEMVGAVTGDSTMTGRTGVWDYTFWRVGDRALTGVGYGSFWEVDPYVSEVLNDFGVYFQVNQSHNGYIGVFAEMGWLGVGVVFAMMILAFSAILRRVANAREEPIVGYALYTALGYALYNITETSFFRAGYDTWIHYLIMMLAVAKLVAPVPAGRQAPRPRAQRRAAPRAALAPSPRTRLAP